MREGAAGHGHGPGGDGGGRDGGGGEGDGLVSMRVKIYREEGVPGLYAGLLARVLQVRRAAPRRRSSACVAAARFAIPPPHPHTNRLRLPLYCHSVTR